MHTLRCLVRARNRETIRNSRTPRHWGLDWWAWKSPPRTARGRISRPFLMARGVRRRHRGANLLDAADRRVSHARARSARTPRLPRAPAHPRTSTPPSDSSNKPVCRAARFCSGNGDRSAHRADRRSLLAWKKRSARSSFALGTNHIGQGSNAPQIFTISTNRPHPAWRPSADRRPTAHDLDVVTLNETVPLSDFPEIATSPAPILPRFDYDAIGYGRLPGSSTMSGFGVRRLTPITLSSALDRILSDTISAFGTQNTCSGDSGGA